MKRAADPPLKYLRSAINNTILVKLKDGSEYMGRLKYCDPTMNLLLEECVEVKESGKKPSTKYGLVLIRGSNILYVSTDYTQTL